MDCYWKPQFVATCFLACKEIDIFIHNWRIIVFLHSSKKLWFPQTKRQLIFLMFNSFIDIQQSNYLYISDLSERWCLTKNTLRSKENLKLDWIWNIMGGDVYRFNNRTRCSYWHDSSSSNSSKYILYVQIKPNRCQAVKYPVMLKINVPFLLCHSAFNRPNQNNIVIHFQSP